MQKIYNKIYRHKENKNKNLGGFWTQMDFDSIP